MQITVHASSPAACGHTAVEDYLNHAMPPVGAAIRTVEVELLLTGGRGESLRRPRISVRRLRRRIDLGVVSTLSAQELAGTSTSPELFGRAVREVVAAMAAIPGRMHRRDDLDFLALGAHLTDRVAQLPGDALELHRILDRCRAGQLLAS